MSRLCVICNSDNSKYQCPKCFSYYCLVICCKLHKSFSCEQFLAAPESATVQTQRNQEDGEPQVNPTAAAVAFRDLQSVSKDQLQIILKNPLLKSFREDMGGLANVAGAMTKAMH